MGSGKKPSPGKGARFAGEVVLVGLEHSGKTLLCRALERHCSGAGARARGKKAAVAAAPPALNAATQPSIGIELLELPHRGRLLPLREAGGTMQPVWERYLSRAAAVVFVADCASSEGACGAVVELCDVLRQLPTTRVLLFLNKRDAPTALPEETVRMRFEFGICTSDLGYPPRTTTILLSATTFSVRNRRRLPTTVCSDGRTPQ